eukprot:TRINITY_DN81076_c0_g1_i1.p2 TRINITY_DN81076_c0_g1~~TRINITY_DN81076_c0_g1_i1.p2  ORF type:complete len:101 (-),score=0.95 TRINITY_DN81076_c0_g1_i1:1247-1549(-)
MRTNDTAKSGYGHMIPNGASCHVQRNRTGGSRLIRTYVFYVVFRGESQTGYMLLHRISNREQFVGYLVAGLLSVACFCSQAVLLSRQSYLKQHISRSSDL